MRNKKLMLALVLTGLITSLSSCDTVFIANSSNSSVVDISDNINSGSTSLNSEDSNSINNSNISSIDNSSSSQDSSSIDIVETVISNKDKDIPSNLTFTGDDSGTNSITIDLKDIKVSGSYSSNYSTSGRFTNGLNIGFYRATGSKLLLPDTSDFRNTSYSGREGAFYNDEFFGQITSFDVTYLASSPVGDVKPNVTFGVNKTCDDYRYFLDVDSTFQTAHISVPNSGYEYFSINTGSYSLNVSSFTVNYTQGSQKGNSSLATSGENKIRCNPVRCIDSPLVAGQSQVTVPMNVVYNSSDNTYYATESKTYTYYTMSYVQSHPEVQDDAALIDPLDICAYYNAFGTWPANYAESKPSYLFGNKARQVSKYNRTNGYARSVPWCKQGYYYELDIDVDGTYSNGPRGTGRVVCWDKGFTSTGYDNSPVCLYTNDHYNQWREYLNNGSWSYIFNGEGNISGRTYSTPKTVNLTNFTTGQGVINAGEDSGNTTSENVNYTDGEGIDSEEYYANHAPLEIINNKTALYQKVTSINGLVEGSKYLIINEQNANKGSFTCGFSYTVNESNHSISLIDENKKQYEKPLYIELASSKTGYLYTLNDDDSIKYIGNSEKNITQNKTLYNFGFTDNGDFVVRNGNYYLRFNTRVDNGPYRFYQNASQSPIQLYRYCDIKGAKPEEKEYYDYKYSMVNSLNDISKKGQYLLVAPEFNVSLSGTNFSYDVDLDNKDLKVAKDETSLKLIKFKKNSKYKDLNLYYIYYEAYDSFLDDYQQYSLFFNEEYNMFTFSYLDSTSFMISIDDLTGLITLQPYKCEEDKEPTPYKLNNEECYLSYNSDNHIFECSNNHTETDLYLFKFITDEPENSLETNLVNNIEVTDEKEYILVSKTNSKCFGDDGEAIYSINDKNRLSVNGNTSFVTLHFEKYLKTFFGNDGKEEKYLYAIYIMDGNTKKYLNYVDDYKVTDGCITFGDEPSYFDITFNYLGYVNIYATYYRSSLDDYVELRSQCEYVKLGYDSALNKFKICLYGNEDCVYLYEIVKDD